MPSQQLDLLDGFIQISNQGMTQLHLITETSHVIMIYNMQHHSFCSFFSLAQEVAVLEMRHSLITSCHWIAKASRAASLMPPLNVHLFVGASTTW
jgi:hypothetical protein